MINWLDILFVSFSLLWLWVLLISHNLLLQTQPTVSFQLLDEEYAKPTQPLFISTKDHRFVRKKVTSSESLISTITRSWNKISMIYDCGGFTPTILKRKSKWFCSLNKWNKKYVRILNKKIFSNYEKNTWNNFQLVYPFQFRMSCNMEYVAFFSPIILRFQRKPLQN